MSDIIQVNPIVFGGEGESVHANMLTKLWENPDPTADFAAQPITLASNDFDYLLWDVKYAKNVAVSMSFITTKGFKSVFSLVGTTTGAYTATTRRDIDSIDGTEYTLGDCYMQNSNAARSVSNAYLIPIAVYGFKKSLDITAIVSNVSTDARLCMLSDGVTSVETELGKKVEGWTLAGNVTSTSLVTVTVPATAKEILAVLVNPSNVILLSQVIPKALMSSGASLKDVANTAKELYYNGSKWKVTDATYTGKIYYR